MSSVGCGTGPACQERVPEREGWCMWSGRGKRERGVMGSIFNDEGGESVGALG